MSRTGLNFLLDACLLAVFTGNVAVAVVLRFVFPAPTQSDAWRLWGLTYDDWSAANFNLTAFFALLVLLHVMLHWSWVCGVVAQRLSKLKGRTFRVDEASQTVYGVGLLIVVLTAIGVFAAAASVSIRDSDTTTDRLQNGHDGGASGGDVAVVRAAAPRATESAPVITIHQAAACNIRCRNAMPTSEVPSPNSVSMGSVPTPKQAMIAVPRPISPLLIAKARNA